MPKPTDAARLMGVFAKLASSPSAAVSNKSLREELGWDEEKYVRVRDKLIAAGELKRAPGQGGSVKHSDSAVAAPLRLFVSYSHADESIKDLLLAHLSPLIRTGLIEVWHDRMISAGQKWQKEIFDELNCADIVLFLISANFLDSEFCYDKELDISLQRSKKGETKIIPVLVRSCLWKETPLAQFQGATKDMKPITFWPNVDEALTEVASKIHQAAPQIRQSRRQ